MPEQSDLTTRRSPAPRATTDRGAAPGRAAIVLGLLAHLPIALFVLLEVWVGWSQHLWIGVRGDLLVYGAAGIGPLLGCFAVLIGRRTRLRTGGSTFAQGAGWLSLVSGVVVAYLVRGLAGPWLLCWSPLLFGLMLFVVSEREPRK